MQPIKPSFESHSSIEVLVPQPWRTIGRIFTLLLIATFVGFFWRIFFFPEPPDDELLFVAWVNFISTPIFCCFALPLFLNKYPGWFVRLVGQKYLNKFISDCKQNIGSNRAEKAHMLMPQRWFADKRFFWIVMMIGFAVLGIFHANGWL
jgi:hypothetical protein